MRSAISSPRVVMMMCERARPGPSSTWSMTTFMTKTLMSAYMAAEASNTKPEATTTGGVHGKEADADLQRRHAAMHERRQHIRAAGGGATWPRSTSPEAPRRTKRRAKTAESSTCRPSSPARADSPAKARGGQTRAASAIQSPAPIERRESKNSGTLSSRLTRPTPSDGTRWLTIWPMPR